MRRKGLLFIIGERKLAEVSHSCIYRVLLPLDGNSGRKCLKLGCTAWLEIEIPSLRSSAVEEEATKPSAARCH